MLVCRKVLAVELVRMPRDTAVPRQEATVNEQEPYLASAQR